MIIFLKVALRICYSVNPISRDEFHTEKVFSAGCLASVPVRIWDSFYSDLTIIM